MVSAEALVSDSEFRSKLRKIAKKKSKDFGDLLPKANSKVVREDYTVVYGFMRKPYADGLLGLPFFSKVSLLAARQRIEQLNIAVALEIIPKIDSEGTESDDKEET